mgnify:CR=1 FL=1
MKSIYKPLALVALTATATTASADSYFDGKQPLLCSVYQLFECDAPNACTKVTPEQIDGFSHLDIDFKKKLIIQPGVDSDKKSTIKSVETIDSKLFIQSIEDGAQGVRDGAGWTISIMDPEGTMVMAVAADGFGVIALGACVPKP